MKAGLLHHFGSKEELYLEVLRRHYDELRPSIRKQASDLEPWAFVDAWVGLFGSNASRAGFVALYTSVLPSALDPEHLAHDWLHLHFERSVAGLIDGFTDGQERGYIRNDAPVLELARSLVALADGIQVQWLCARADASSTQDSGLRRDGAPLDMADHLRVFIEMLKCRWSA